MDHYLEAFHAINIYEYQINFLNLKMYINALGQQEDWSQLLIIFWQF
jgi:hypothetical protein